ncbi:hypothetical protein ASE01_04970 [Nocardioides sp. Root190]|uniref:SGNH/GDSL hydrolase family protein n=1 Tax=Nocardioides sp. Root190 TaxID=1736488 RepID=UPI000700FDBC|nr:SGNH/GDSL hydrolase family protein [Nocardioides sp. Root190]KRB78605.1 hypothetical protein ASE01_04970 [Nocardioides sp. Root190]
MKTWRSVTALSLALLVLLVVAGSCSTKKQIKADASSNRDRVIETGDTYVALGDSNTSGPGLGTPTFVPGCQQTIGNYPHLLAEEMDLDLVDVSCGGAKTENMTEEQTALGDKVPPQLDAIRKDTALVTLSIGGNDGDVYGSLVLNCVRLGAKDPTGAPCSDLARKHPTALKKVFDGVTDAIVATVAAVLDKAPKARIVVIGYPQIIPADGACAALPLGEGDYPFARGVMEQFDKAQAEAAKEAKAEFLDMWTATEGHDICSEDPWVAGVRPQEAGIAYHPYAAGQEAVVEELQALVSAPGASLGS